MKNEDGEDSEKDNAGEASEDVVEPTVLKQRQTSAVTKVTKKRNAIVRLMMNTDNLHDVKTGLNEYDELFKDYQDAHTLLSDSLLTEDAKQNESQLFHRNEGDILAFRQEVMAWIAGAERTLQKDLDELQERRSSASRSHHSSTRSRRSTRSSRLGSTKSALAHERA